MALYAIGVNELVEGPVLGILADDAGGEYVHPTGYGAGGLDAERVVRVAAQLGRSPTTANEWLAVACTNLGLISISDPYEAPSMEAARSAARAEVDRLEHLRRERVRGADEARERARGQEARAGRLHAIAEAAWDAGMDDEGNLEPEDELGFQLEAAGEVDPRRPHRWLPFTLQETECAFCDQLEDAEIHQRWWES